LDKNLHAGRFWIGEVFRTIATIEKSNKGQTSSKRKRTYKKNDFFFKKYISI